MKPVSSILALFIIIILTLCCKREEINSSVSKDRYIKNMVFSGDKKFFNFYKIKVKKEIDENCISFVYFEKHEFQTYDTLIFKKDIIYYRGNKLVKIDSMEINLNDKKIKINKLVYLNDIYPQKFLTFYVNKEIGIISKKSEYNNVNVFYDVENNYELNNKIESYDFLKYTVE